MTARNLRITVAYASTGVEAIVALEVPPGASVADAVAQSGLADRPGIAAAALEFAIHGRRVRRDTPLADGDRVELTRPLLADPKQARRARARRTPVPRARPA